MPLARADSSVLVVIDVQPFFLKAIHDAERVVARSEFLVRIARLLDVPILSTVQNPGRMGGLDPRIVPHLSSPPIGKMTFACAGCPEFDEALERTAGVGRRASGGGRQTPDAEPQAEFRNPKSEIRNQAVLAGIETHICVTQTAIRLHDAGWQAIVCEDAVSARRQEMNDIGFRRLRHAGVDVAHTESVAYEWLGTADHPRFREALEIVKSNAE